MAVPEMLNPSKIKMASSGTYIHSFQSNNIAGFDREYWLTLFICKSARE